MLKGLAFLGLEQGRWRGGGDRQPGVMTGMLLAVVEGGGAGVTRRGQSCLLAA